MLKKIVIALSLLLWPLNIFLNFSSLHPSTKTIFTNDYQGEQLVLRNIHLYPNPLMARVFQNKPRIYINKYLDNFFALTDPNNYFFGLHPEPITGNLNLFKFPFLSIVFFFVGLFYIKDFKYKKIVMAISIPAVFVLSSLSKFEGFDFILWVPISLIIINGINYFEKFNKKIFNYFSLIFILFSFTEILRSFFNK